MSVPRFVVVCFLVGGAIGLLGELHFAKVVGFGSLFAGSLVLVAAVGQGPDLERTGQLVGGFFVIAGVVLSVARDFSTMQRDLAMVVGCVVGGIVFAIVSLMRGGSSPRGEEPSEWK